MIDWLDDHRRYLLAYGAARVGAMLSTFTARGTEDDLLASTLTDNGVVYTGRFVGGRNAFKDLLAQPRLRSVRAADDLQQLQAQLHAFNAHYNELRPHRALKGATPGTAYRSTPKATPATGGEATHYRVRKDRVDKLGLLTLRHASRLHHLGVGIRHKRERVIILVDATTATVINQQTGEILSRHNIDPNMDYWRNHDRSPGRWPQSTKKSGTSAP